MEEVTMRPHMHAVLVGDDGSDDADAAIRWAARFADERQSELFGVHVRAGDGEDVADRIAQTFVPTGNPAAAIIEAAHDLDADVIVLGRRGRSGFAQAALGGVAYHVAALSDLPVVVVPVAEETQGAALVGE